MKLLYRIIFIAAFLGLFYFVVAYARGYRIDFKKKSLTPTGIVAVTSTPKAAKIYVNGTLRGVTDTNLTLPPGSYQIEIKKEGYTAYSRNIVLKGELVASVDASLFPVNATLSPLTNLGIVKAVPLDGTDKIIIFIDNPTESENTEKNGIYMFEGGRKPLPFFPPLQPIILKQNLNPALDFSKASVIISPDTKEGIFEFDDNGNKSAYLLSLDSENQLPFDVTASKDSLIEAWDKEQRANDLKILETYPEDFARIASDSVKIISFSPSETKVLYQAGENIGLPPMITPPIIASNQTPEQRTIEKDKIYVYDRKEDKNYLIDTPQTTDPLISNTVQWYFDSKHLLVNQGKKIQVVDYDNTNLQTVYSGPFEGDFFMTTSDGKIITLSNLNPEVNKLPDLYLVGVR